MKDISSKSIRSDLYSVCSLDFRPGARNEPSPCILSVLASLLERLVARNERQLLCSGANQDIRGKLMKCVFSATQVPAMSIQRYLERIFKYAQCSPSAFVVAYAYIDRLIQFSPDFTITSLNVHRLLITTVMVAAKFLDDLHYRNAYYAKVGGLTTGELNHLEIQLLSMLRFRLQVTVSVFESYCSHLEREVALGGGYQIERSLLCVCRIHEDSAKKQKLSLISC